MAVRQEIKTFFKSLKYYGRLFLYELIIALMFFFVLRAFCFGVRLGVSAIFDLIPIRSFAAAGDAIDALISQSWSFFLDHSAYISFAADAIFLVWFLRNSGYKKIFCRRPNPFRLAKYACLGIVFSVAAAIFVSVLSQILPESYIETYEKTIDLVSAEKIPIVIQLLFLGLIGPIAEELVFRFCICSTYSQYPRIVAILVSSIVFGVAHGNLIQGLYAGLGGLAISAIYTKHKTIWYPIVIHVSMNAFSVLRAEVFSIIITLIITLVAAMAAIALHLELREREMT